MYTASRLPFCGCVGMVFKLEFIVKRGSNFRCRGWAEWRFRGRNCFGFGVYAVVVVAARWVILLDEADYMLCGIWC